MRGSRTPWSVLRDQAVIFVVALLIRGIIGWVFFGGQDLVNDVQAAGVMMSGEQFKDIPYLPGIQLFIWVGGMLAAKTSWPAAFGFKIIPMVCDSMIAVIVHDVCRRRGRTRDGWIGGLLYAACPIAVYVAVGQVQWDPVFLLCVLMAFELKDHTSSAWRFVAGALFGMAIIIKPVPILLLPCLFSQPSAIMTSVEYVRRETVKLAGLAAFFGVWAFVTSAAKYPCMEAIPMTIKYAKEGWTSLQPLMRGLPFEALRKNRFLILFAIAPVWLAYLRAKIDAHAAALLVFGVLIGTCPLAPQYLVWLVPFAIMYRRYLFLAIYDVVVVRFLFLFVNNTKAMPYPYEGTVTFAPLRSKAWLAPSLAHSDELMPKVRLFADWLVPLCALGLVVAFVAGLLVARIRRRTPLAPARRERRVPTWAYAIFLVVVVSTTYAVARMPSPPGSEYHEIIELKLKDYELGPKALTYSLPSSYETKEPTAHDATALGTDWAYAWSALALLIAAASIRRSALIELIERVARRW